MRLAAYNVENLFDRAKILNLDNQADAKPVLEAFAKLNNLIGRVKYTDAAKRQMIEMLKDLGLEKSDQGKYVILRQNRGEFLKRPKTGGIVIVANERADWAGSLELIDEPVDENAMRNTARMLSDLEADVVGVVEAENRPTLRDFNKAIIPAVGGIPFQGVMVIDGNDSRGIDVGLLCRDEYEIVSMRSHVDDKLDDGENVFSRDCPEYTVVTPKGNRLVVMVNHFKSKGYGSPATSNARRKAQASRVKAIYDGLIASGEEFIAVVGDLNDTPGSDPLKPLLSGTDMVDAFEHPDFDDGGHPGTYGSCLASNKIDYLLLSPKLNDKLVKGGVMRQGMWPGVRPKKWDVYPSIKDKRDAASDHAAIWVDLDI